MFTTMQPPIASDPTHSPAAHSRIAETDAVLMLEVDIARPIPSVLFLDLETGRRYRYGLLLVRMHTRPVGMIELESTQFQIRPQELAALIWRDLWREIKAAMVAEGLPPISTLDAFGLPPIRTPRSLVERAALGEHAPLASIVVCTHDRPDQVATCINALKRLNYPGGFEIIVVDSAPSSDETETLIARDYDDDVLYLREDQPGVALARNRGLAAAVGEMIAFTDDDAIVEPNWLIELLRGFYAAEHVAGVIGLTLPGEVEISAQAWFQQERGGARGFHPQVFDLHNRHSQTAQHRFRAPLSGAGVNMAFQTSVLREIGGFDPTLGVGTATHSGEDMAAFFEILLRGHQMAYEPGAIVYHNHRETYAALRDQLYGFSVGSSAHLVRAARRILNDNPGLLFQLAGRMPLNLIAGAVRAKHAPLRRTQARPLLWLELHVLEWCGFARGPLAYQRTRRQTAG